MFDPARFSSQSLIHLSSLTSQRNRDQSKLLMVDKLATLIEPVFDDKGFDPKRLHDSLTRHLIHNVSSCSKLDGFTQNIFDIMRVRPILNNNLRV